MSLALCQVQCCRYCEALRSIRRGPVEVVRMNPARHPCGGLMNATGGLCHRTTYNVSTCRTRASGAARLLELEGVWRIP